MLELDPKSTVASPKRKQRSRTLLAVALLFLAVVGLVVKNRNAWFGPEPDSDVVGPEIAHSNPPQPAPSAVPDKTQDKTQDKTKAQAPVRKQPAAAKTPSEPQPEKPPVVATERTVLPPLDVEVVAGDKHSQVHPGSNTTNVVIANNQPSAPAINAADRQSLSTTIQASGPSNDGTYPLLAQQMKVQGSVVLQALIGADGFIEDLRVVTGPAILTSAAREAVRQWRFKPYLHNGQPVETKAKITVNFTIRVADNSATSS